MGEMKVLILSSVVPNARGSGGELVLHRHLEVKSRTFDARLCPWQRFPFRLKLIGKLRQLGFRSVPQSWECLFPVLPPAKMVHDLIESFRPHRSAHCCSRLVAHTGEKSREGVESPTGVFVPRLVAGFSGDSGRVRSTCRTAISPDVQGERCGDLRKRSNAGGIR